MSKRTKIESRKCPSCGGELEIREDLAHGIVRCPSCKSAVNMFIEEPTEEEREYDSVSGRVKKEKIKYNEKGAFTRRTPFLPTTGFRKVPQEYDKESMSYVSLRNILDYVEKIKSIDDIKGMERSCQELVEFSQSGQPTYNMGRDLYKLSVYLNRARLYSDAKGSALNPVGYQEAKDAAKEAFELAQRHRKTLEEKVGKAEGQLKRNKKDYESRLEVYSKAVAVIGIIGAGIFFSSNLTGNAIADLSTNTTSWAGGVLLVVVLVAGFFWIKNKKKIQIKESSKKKQKKIKRKKSSKKVKKKK